MSLWYEITDEEDVSLSEDGKHLQVNYDSDKNGNLWVEIPLEFIERLMKLQMDKNENNSNLS